MTPCIEPKIGGPIQVHKSYPHIYLGVVNNKQKHVALRRLVMASVLGRSPVMVGCTCGNRNCINPNHLFETTLKAVRKASSDKLWTAQKAAEVRL